MLTFIPKAYNFLATRMDYDIGFHVISESALERHELFEEEMSIVAFLKRVKYQAELPYDVVVYGFDDFLRTAADPAATTEYVHVVLRDSVNHLNIKNPRVQFVVSDVEFWDEPVLRHGEQEIPLRDVFHGIEQEGSGWYYSRINVQS